MRWSAEKNRLLAVERGITFERVVVAVEMGRLLDTMEHPNRQRYPNQRILIVEIDGYAFVVPYVEEEEQIFLKTVIPSRKATRDYLGSKTGSEGADDERA